jgi:murein DD-endopeptidase MepM/ murein hydrolase activator NlpD
MQKQISFYAVSNTSASVKQITCSARTLNIFVFFIVIILSGVGYVSYRYAGLKQIEASNRSLEESFMQQRQTIANQRKQIVTFAKDINGLKSKIIQMNDFEKKIRIMANIENNPKSNSLFGVGGTTPADLDTGLPLTEKHNSLIRDIHEQVDVLKSASLAQEKALVSLTHQLQEKLNYLAATPAIRPLKKGDGWVASRFGYRKSPFTGRKQFHPGLDIAAPKGTPILATADGVVSFAKKKGLMGNMLVINHGYGMVTRYGHIDKFIKKRGDKVKRGEVIATVGNTGRSTGPHVHYEVRLNGVNINPVKYILN